MRLLLKLTVSCLFLSSFANAQSGKIVTVDLQQQKLSLDGDWDFSPAQGNFKPADASPKAIDEKALQINNASVIKNDDWQTVKSPQFLNRISWWLPNVSEAYEKQEEMRVKSFPFDADKIQSGWYQKTLELPKGFKATKNELYANFEGVATISRVYCNGSYVGGHLGMFGSFSCRLTPYLKKGKNTLAVYVERGVVAEKGNEVVSIAVTVPVTRDMLASLNSGMFGGFGNGPRAKFMGIWQPVTLEVSKVGGKIEDVFFKPTLTGHALQIELTNPNKKATKNQISYSIKDKKTGQLLVDEKSGDIVSINPNQKNTITISKDGLSPHLWTPDRPYLYQLQVVLKDEKGNQLDKYECEVGYRTVSTKGKNIILNGKPYWVRGANMPPYGYKPNDEPTAKGFLQLMHDGNTVITRTHGNPWNELWYSLADEIGIGVSSEGVRPWALMTTAPPPNNAILAHWKQEQLESIKKYRNHPSILFYELSNEGLQGDYENPAKLAIFKELIDAVKKLDDSRPVFQTSGDPDVKKQSDIEDVHSYWGWYDSSSFVNDYTKNKRGLNSTNGMPFVNEECAVPYSMIDNGAVHPAYVGRYAAQSWVGDIGTYSKDVSYFQNHIYQEAKMKAEKLRYSRNYVDNSGFMLFSNVTWIQNALSKPVKDWKPFPVYDGVKEGFQPILTALSTAQRNFFAGDTIKTNLFIVNDDKDFRDIKNTNLLIAIKDAKGNVLQSQKLSCGDVNYFDTKTYLVTLIMPAVNLDKEYCTIALALSDEQKEILSQNTYQIRIYANPKTETQPIKILSLGNTNAVNTALKKMGALSTTESNVKNADVIILGPQANLTGVGVVKHLKKGGRLIVLQQKADAHRFCEDILIPDGEAIGDKSANNDSYMFTVSKIFKNSLETSKGEFVEMLNWDKHPPLFKNLDAMDWKWWAMRDSSAAYVSSASHHIDIKNPKVNPIGRYLNSHFYWQGNLKKVYDNTISYPVFSVVKDYGDLVVCELNISESIDKDPRAETTLRNLVLEKIVN